MKKAILSLCLFVGLLILFHFWINEPVRYIPNTPGYVVTARNVPRVSTFEWWGVLVDGMAADLIWAFPDADTVDILGDADPDIQKVWSARVSYQNGEVVSLLLLTNQSWVVVNEGNYPTTRKGLRVGEVLWREEPTADEESEQ